MKGQLSWDQGLEGRIEEFQAKKEQQTLKSLEAQRPWGLQVTQGSLEQKELGRGRRSEVAWGGEEVETTLSSNT
jgi:hypothetical protein